MYLRASMVRNTELVQSCGLCPLPMGSRQFSLWRERIIADVQFQL